MTSTGAASAPNMLATQTFAVATFAATIVFGVVRVDVRRLSHDFDVERLFEFLMRHGKTEHNWVPAEPVREHLNGLAAGLISVWAAFDGDEILGYITAKPGGQYEIQTRAGETTEEIGEFVVDAGRRGLGIGRKLARAAVRGVFSTRRPVDDLFVMVHADNIGSIRCFRAAGFTERLTYADPHRDRRTIALHVPRPTRVLGLQSGNAVDGIDVVVVDFPPPIVGDPDSRHVERVVYDMVAFEVVDWPEDAREEVLRLRDGRAEGIDYARADYRLAKCFADAARGVVERHGIDLDTIDLVSSHGQSIFGHPHWELGELAVLAQELRITTVGDFRPSDVAAGGNGSPCTATYDSLMLRPESGWRMCINIGGTTSVTFCPPQGAEAQPIGLDPGTGMFFLDLNAQRVLGKPYDDGGKLAASGTVCEPLVAEMLEHPHYQRDTLPIAIGVEDFPRSLFGRWLERSQELGCSDADLQASLSELVSRTLARSATRFGPSEPITEVIVRGGVRNNADFMSRLRGHVAEAIDRPDLELKGLADLGHDEASWETVMYALFGFLCVSGLHNFVPSCTGADRPVIGGKICPSDNFGALQLR